MIGPGLQKGSAASKTASIVLKQNDVSEVTKNISVNHIENGNRLLHDHPRAFDLMRDADAFVLFNPGFGCKHLKSSWEPTLKLLLETRKPIIATAHSHHDLSRDMTTLADWTLEEDSQDLGEPVEMIFGK